MESLRQAPRRQSDRRAQPDRRFNLDRRRGADARDVALEISGSMIHLALIVRNEGSEPEKVVTRSVAWRKESTTLYSELVAEERLSGAQVHIALSGEFCVTRVVIGSTEDVRRELAELKERSHRYLTL